MLQNNFMDAPTDILLSVQLSHALELGLGVWIIRMLAFGLTVLQMCSRWTPPLLVFALDTNPTEFTLAQVAYCMNHNRGWKQTSGAFRFDRSYAARVRLLLRALETTVGNPTTFASSLLRVKGACRLSGSRCIPLR